MFKPLQTVEEFFEAASKILHLDSSHDKIRSKVQGALSAAHRTANAGSDSGSYYDTPYVRDMYGNEDSGQVVHSHREKLTLSQYKKAKDGSYDITNHKNVKQAYVVVSDKDADDKKESLQVVIDGHERTMQETVATLSELSEVIELQEAASGGANSKLTLITAGKGSSGYYTEASLKKAAKDGIFAKGVQMFLNHQTREERLARPEGDITKLAATLTGNAEYVEGNGTTPGKLVAPANIYPEFKPFIASRKDDIGVSIRVGATPSGKVQDGVPLVENMVYALSADFVTKAGRGGKIDELYESYRASHPGERQPAASGDVKMTDQEKQQLTTLQESVGRLTANYDRLLEDNTKLTATTLLTEALATSNLKPRGCNRVRTVVLANLPLTADKALDVTKFNESVKAAIADEVAYLQESGVHIGPQIVRYQGAVSTVGQDGKELSEAEVIKNSEAILSEAVKALTGKEKTA